MDNSNKLITIGILIILSINLVFALGVNSPYWQTNPLKMYPGETKEVVFPLVNSVNEPTTEATVSLTKGNEIAEIISGDKYNVNPGENDKNIVLRITIPENAKIGDDYGVGFKVLYIPAGESGNVKLNVEYNIDFPVQIVSQADATSTTNPDTSITPNTPNDDTTNPDTSNTNLGNLKAITPYTIIIILIIAIIVAIAITILILFKQKKNNEQKQGKFK